MLRGRWSSLGLAFLLAACNGDDSAGTASASGTDSATDSGSGSTSVTTATVTDSNSGSGTDTTVGTGSSDSASTGPTTGGSSTDSATTGSTTDPTATGSTTDPTATGSTTDPTATGSTTDPTTGGSTGGGSTGGVTATTTATTSGGSGSSTTNATTSGGSGSSTTNATTSGGSGSSTTTTTGGSGSSTTTTTGGSGSSTTTTTGGSSTTTTGSGSVTGIATTGGGCTILMCGNKILECGDCIDNDMDGVTDIADPECVTPCDDDESKFATGIPGDNMDPCKQDCFFDGNSGAGDDKCEWNLKCDPNNPGAPECPYDPGFMSCPMGQDQKCIDECDVPNGCDCFGCCTVEYMNMEYDVFLGDPNCDINNIPNCAPCQKNMDCDNPCVDCEVCFGMNEPPEGCGEPECPDNLTPCDIGEVDPCEEGFFCQTGCCVELPK